ncbi:Peroxidase 2 [Triticum urartu]|uniref:Peroxidase 2 n=1 Tax=Triticum urartu TaxID=4572 RepID=M7ZLL7_TRIUA|nr:Peroxidase 2 [Triticum urartu]
MAAVAAKPHVLVACALLLLAVGCQASPFWPLEIGYYHDKCPQAEAVVKGVMEQAISQNPGNGAAMIRMLFHDCFVEGCDASVLLDPTPFSPTPEKLSPPNDPTLRGFELIDAIKDALEAACPGVVSCADIVACAARAAARILSSGKDVVTPNKLDRQYYKNVLSHTVLFTSDAALMTSAETARMVVENAKIPGWWEDRFEKAMVKMAGIEVKAGYQGQIRKNCRAINHY